MIILYIVFFILSFFIYKIFRFFNLLSNKWLFLAIVFVLAFIIFLYISNAFYGVPDGAKTISREELESW
jgi:uncharacterized membrane protein YbhN (UPF0104 family)